MKYSAVLFDIDGTIIGLEPVIKGIIEICRRMDFEIPSEDEIKEDVIPPTFQDYFRKKYNLDEQQIRRAENIYMTFYRNHGTSYERMFPDVMPVLGELKEAGVKIGIITNKMREEAQITLNHFNLQPDVLITKEDVIKKKPDPEPVAKACKKVWVRPQACVFVGDSTVDIESGKAAGVVTVGITTGTASRQALVRTGADNVIDDLREVLKIVV